MKMPATALALVLFAALGCHTHAHIDDDTAEAHVSVDDDECHGALSCTAEVVGDIVMLPFRIVGGVIDFIF